MESYIVRIYRRGDSGLNEVAGLVEAVGSNERLAFQSFPGLVTAIKQALGHDVDDAGLEASASFSRKAIRMT